jgi:hypothetical protein
MEPSVSGRARKRRLETAGLLLLNTEYGANSLVDAEDFAGLRSDSRGHLGGCDVGPGEHAAVK